MRRGFQPVAAGVGTALLALIAGTAGCRDTGSSDAPTALPPEAIGERAGEIFALGDPFERSLRLHELLGQATPEALPALLAALEAAPIDSGEPEIVTLALWWARFDREAALRWTHQSWRALSGPVVAAVFRAWANADPEDAFRRMSEAPPLFFDAAVHAVVAGWRESGQPGLVEQVEAVPDLALRQKIGEALSRQMVLALGAEGALRWVEEIDSPAFQKLMSLRVVSSAAEQGRGADLAAWAEQRVTAGDERPSGFPRRLGTRWIVREPEAALAWLSSLPAGKDREDGVMESVRDWFRFQPAAARRWFESAEPEPWLEPGLSIYARQLAKEDPLEALELVGQFSDEALRNRISIVIVRAWGANDPEAALEWVAQSDLPEGARHLASAGLRRAVRGADEADGPEPGEAAPLAPAP